MRYGWHGANALRVQIESDYRRTLWEDYTAITLFGLGKSLKGDEWPLPSWTELAYKKQTVDNRSGKEVMEGVKASFRRIKGDG